MLVRAVPVLLLSLAACRAPEAPTPAPPPTPDTRDKSAVDGPSVDEPEAGPAAAVEASPNDAILEAILTDDRFAMYLHPDVAGRVPVVVSGAARPKAIALELHGAAVETKPVESLAREQAFLDIETWSVEEDRASVKLAYEIEGVVASFDLERDASGRWIVATASVVER